MEESEDRMHGGSNARRVGCPEVMKSESLCLSRVSTGVRKRERETYVEENGCVVVDGRIGGQLRCD